MRVPTEYRVWLERDEWIATPVTSDPRYMRVEGFGTTPEEAITRVGEHVATLIERQLDEIRKNAGEAKR